MNENKKTEERQRRSSDAALEIIAERMNRMAIDMDDMRMSMKELSHAMSRIAIVEERIARNASATERAFKNIEGIDQRVTTLESKSVQYGKTTDWVDKVIWAVIGAVLLAVLFKAGITAR